MTSNPKKTITIVKPDATRAPGLQGPRVFVGDVEIPVESLYVDWEEGTVDVTLAPDEVRIASDVPTPAQPENMPNPERAKPRMDEFRFEADLESLVVTTENDVEDRGTIKYRIVFKSPHPAAGDDVATVSLAYPSLELATSPTDCKCSACDPRGAR